MSSAQEKGQFHCRPCNRFFPSREAIHTHRAYMRRTGSRDHIHCKFCGLEFKTEAAEDLHIVQMHPQEQKLDCPGCGRGPFPRLASLISHFEKGECIRIDESVLDEMREKKLEFARQLETLTKESVKNNYTGYVTQRRIPSPGHAWGDVQGSGSKFTDVDFPSLPQKAGNTAEQAPKPSAEGEHHQVGEGVAWKGKENLFPDAPWAQKPTASQLQAASEPSPRVVFQSMDADDPDNPAFNAARYYSDVIEQYICPKIRCGKCFKNQGGLVRHLRSPAHGNISYRCPYCQREFKSLTAITSHVESSTVNCRMRETDSYEAYLDQLTAGVVNVGKTHEDGTPQYHTPDRVRGMFRGGKSQSDSLKDHNNVQW